MLEAALEMVFAMVFVIEVGIGFEIVVVAVIVMDG